MTTNGYFRFIGILVRQALVGYGDPAMKALNGAFVWEESPQGHKFWQDQSEAGRLSPEGRLALEQMLRSPDPLYDSLPPKLADPVEYQILVEAGEAIHG